MPNAQLAGRTFSTVLVVGKFQSLEQRRLAEERLCSELSNATTCRCVAWSQAFFPGQDYSADQIRENLQRLQIDAVLTLQPTGSGTSTSYVPQSSTTTSNAYVTGNTITGTSKTQTSGGYNINKPWASFEATLWSVADDQIAWYATAESGGNAYAGWDNLIKSAAGKTINGLVADGVLR
jgi:hypothetical protein